MIFVDTSFWVALVAARDDHHRESRGLLERHAEEHLVTTNQVRGEAWTFIRRRYGHRPAVMLLDALRDSPRISVSFVTEDLEEQALRWLRRRDERVYSFVDAGSFAFMRSIKAARALTFDDEFEAAGFQVMRL
ncbi:type II toxin-antitoxin system toxin 23S rRNA-specific endonuclease VapC20 [soil metagenome]